MEIRARSIHQLGGQTKAWEAGFTLIEMLISMAMGLVLIAGLTSIFIADSNTSRVISARTERMGDLFLVSHLMQEAIRESVSVTNPNPSFPADLSAGARKPVGTCSSPNNKSVSLPANYPASFPFYPYWDAASKTITYQDLDGNTGIFQYQRPSSNCPSNGAVCIYWLRPNPCIYTFQELIRGLDSVNGMVIYDPDTNNAVTTALGGGMRIDLTSTYTNSDKQGKTLSLSFTMWPRN